MATRNRNKRLTPDERAEAIQRLKAGGQIKAVSEMFSVSRDTIRKIRDAELRGDEAVTTGMQPIAARISAAEARAFDAVLNRAGYRNRSDGLRALVRLATGFLELPGDEGAELDAISRELNKIGVNINQMARLANSGRLPMNGRQMEEFRALHRDLKQLRTFLVQMNTERRARLWRAGQGGHAAVLKKIHRGGTHSAKQLGAQLDYLFSKAEWCGGNIVDFDPSRRTLSPEERAEIVTTWSDGWTRDPKNVHSTHLLLSLPQHVSPKTARAIAEDWRRTCSTAGTTAIPGLMSPLCTPIGRIRMSMPWCRTGAWRMTHGSKWREATSSIFTT